MGTDVIKVTSPSDVEPASARGAEALRAGKLVAFPTETVYGLAVDASNDRSFKRLRDLKDRPQRPFTVHIASPEDARRLELQQGDTVLVGSDGHSVRGTVHVRAGAPAGSVFLETALAEDSAATLEGPLVEVRRP